MGVKRSRRRTMACKGDSPFENLPDEITSKIISFMPMKEAVRTSVLSKKWRYIWTCRSDLRFDCVNVLGIKAQPRPLTCMNATTRRHTSHKFAWGVDQMISRHHHTHKINSLTVCYHLGQEFASRIDRWISCAVAKQVETIALDLSEGFGYVNCSCSLKLDHYKFDCSLLAPSGGKGSLKRLKLDSCALVLPPPGHNCLNSLVTLELQRVCISDELLKKLLPCCLFLETLNLQLCQELVNLDISEPRLRLKLLRIQDCLRLNKFEISSETLVSFEYIGPLVTFSFRHVPNLAEAFFCYSDKTRLQGVTYALTRLSSAVPRLEKLNLFSILSMNALELPETDPGFTNVKELVLSVYPFDDEDRLSWIAYILRAFPLLQKLQLNLFSPSFVKQAKEVKRLLPECPHEHLTEIEINGFYGNNHEVELVKYLLENSVALKVLAITPCQKVYRGLNIHVYEKETSHYTSRRDRILKWLLEAVPSTARLDVR